MRKNIPSAFLAEINFLALYNYGSALNAVVYNISLFGTVETRYNELV